MTGTPELTKVREAHRFDEAALVRYLSERLDGDFSALTVRQFEGGQSNPTYLLTAGGRQYVMRKKPPGQLLKSAHAVDREYRVMTALASSAVPVPRTHLLCEDESVIGTAWYLMEYVEGRVFVDPMLSSLAESDRAALYDHFIEVLAALHSVDYQTAGLEDFGRPGNYYERQISRWTKQYVASKTDEMPAMDALAEWLVANTPEAGQSTIVHGDFRIGNCIVHPSQPRIVAVLDWELSTIGHALADVAYCAMIYYNTDPDPSPIPAGIPTEAEFLKRYCELTGRAGIDNWPFYVVFSLYRYAAILQGVFKRGLDGNASSNYWRRAGEQARRIAVKAWSLVEGA